MPQCPSAVNATYRLLSRRLIFIVVVTQLHGIAHVGQTHAERRCFALSCFTVAVTALGSTDGPNTLASVGYSWGLVAVFDN
jgi:hypothetical protein